MMNQKKQIIWKTGIILMLLFLAGQFAWSARAENSVSSEQETETKAEIETAVCAFDAPAHAVYLPIIIGGNNNPPTPAPLSRELSYEVGKTYTYDYETSTSSVFNTTTSERTTVGVPNTTLSYGQAKISITGKDGNDIFIGQIVLENPTICAQNSDAPDEFMDDPDTLADLQTPLIFKQHKNGTIVDVQIGTNVDGETANYLKGVLNSLQATLASGDSYAATEDGGQGSYRAEYTAVLQQNGLQLTKTLNEESFTTFYSQGEDPVLKLDNTVHMLLDRERGVFSRVSFHETIDIIDAPTTETTELDGVAIWGKTESSGWLALTAVDTTAATQLAANSSLTYQSSSMAADLGDIEQLTHGINLDTLDLQAELDAYEANPDDPALFQRMRWIIIADSDNSAATVLNVIAVRLTNNIANEGVARAYIELLANEGSSFAQSQIINLIDPDNAPATVTRELRQHAMIHLALVDTPESAATAMMTTVINHRSVPTDTINIATTALGAMAGNLADSDPVAARTIYDDFTAQLAAATTNDDKQLFLLALGNIGDPDLFTLVQPYLSNPDPQVQWAAYIALGDVPGEDAENELILGLDDEGWLVDPFVKPGIAITLKNRPGKPSDNANDALAGYYGDPPQGATYKYYWNKQIGGDIIGGSLPGELVWKSPPYTERLHASVSQNIDYHLNLPKFDYQHNGTLAYANAWSIPKNASTQEFGYVYDVLGKTFGPSKLSIPCADNDGDTIASNPNMEIVHAQFEYPVWWILKVGVELDLTANYGIDYSYDWDVCNAGNMSAKLNLIPYGKVNATADGYTKLTVLRGGVKLQANVVDAQIPAELSATYSFQDDFEACVKLPLDLELLHVYFYIYAERWKPLKWAWDPIAGATVLVWDYSVLDESYDLVNKCWTP